jgi:hypothetical protein
MISKAGTPVRVWNGSAVVPAHLRGKVRSSGLGASSGLLSTLPSNTLRESYGVNVHNAWQWSPYANTSANMDKVVELMDELGASIWRDAYTPNETQSSIMAPELVALGCKQYVTIGTYSSTAADIESLIDSLVAEVPNPASRFMAITGLNEPDSQTDPTVDWISHTLELQQTLYTKVRSIPALNDIPVVSPSLRGASITQLDDLAATNIADYVDWGDVHHYPGSDVPTAGSLAEKLAAARRAYKNKPIVMSEYGYVTPSSDLPTAPMPESVYAVYAPRGLCEMLHQGLRGMFTYELLNQSQRSTEYAGNFGLVQTVPINDPTAWTKKAPFMTLQRLIALTRDDGPAFTPAPLSGAVYTDSAKFLSLAKRDGTHALLFWREARVYNPSTKTMLTVTPTTQTVQLSVPRPVIATDITTGAITDMGKVSSFTLPVAGGVVHVAIG